MEQKDMENREEHNETSSDMGSEGVEQDATQNTEQSAAGAGSTAQTQEAQQGGSQFIIWGVVILAVAGLIALGLMFWDTGSTALTDDEVLALIDGEEITMADIQGDLDQMESQYAAQGIDISQEEGMREMLVFQAVQNHVNQRLLLDRARELGLEVDEAAIDEEYATITQQFQTDAEMETALGDAGLTEEGLRDDIRDSLLVQLLAEEEGEITISDEEIQARYEQHQGQIGEDMPPLEDVRDDIERELINEQMGSVLEAMLTEIQNERNVEILVEGPPAPEAPADQQMEMEQGAPQQ